MKKIVLMLSLVFIFFSCEEHIASLEDEKIVRMVIQETQCANPWEFSRDLEEYKNHIKSYLASNGVKAGFVQILDEFPPNSAICMACPCWSGNNIYINVLPTEVGDAEKLGFSKVD